VRLHGQDIVVPVQAANGAIIIIIIITCFVVVVIVFVVCHHGEKDAVHEQRRGQNADTGSLGKAVVLVVVERRRDGPDFEWQPVATRRPTGRRTHLYRESGMVAQDNAVVGTVVFAVAGQSFCCESLKANSAVGQSFFEKEHGWNHGLK